MIGIYIHIPFCVHKCLYCDFPSYGGVLSYRDAYVKALCREIDAWKDTAPVDTIYFGGGTPSLLKSSQVNDILTHLRKKFTVTDDAEITVEANPDSVDSAYAAALYSCGVNRISLGIQSFDDGLLRFLGRIHTAEQARQAVWDVFNKGISNISIDLMYGLPGQTLDMIDHDMEIAGTLPISHASIYSLIVEEGTVLKHRLDHEEFVLPDDVIVEAMKQKVYESMCRLGLFHYEISSYAKENCRSRHNCKYWQYVPYIGFGVSAHSFDGDNRWSNISNIPDYIRKAGRVSVIGEKIAITQERAVEDYCFLALRLRDGIDYRDFAARFKTTIDAEFGAVIKKMMDQELLEKTDRGCRLTNKGLEYGNYVFSRFLRY